MPRTRRDFVFFILGGFFLTNAILAELTGGMLFDVPAPFLDFLGMDVVTLTVGVLPWPIVFITTDLVNEYYGKSGVRKLTFLTVGMISYCFIVLLLAMRIPASEISPITSEMFGAVFGQSMWIIVGSLVAFLVAQLVDVMVFVTFKNRTGRRMLWLRATGSTVVSQLIDTFLVLFIAFVIPRKMTLSQFANVAVGNYAYKLIIAVAITPIIYLAHGLIDRYLHERAEVQPMEAQAPIV